jgi:flagellar P-ring protein precursor FlgI
LKAASIKTQKCIMSNSIAARLPLLAIASSLLVVGMVCSSEAIEARLKDIARIDGLQDSELIGYGVVVGLSGTGDQDLDQTKRTIANILMNFQMSIPYTDIKSKNVAAVMVTARVPAFHQKGDRVDVQVSSMGDAKSLEGGVLLMTPMLDANGKLYALAQGSLSIGGYSTGSSAAGGDAKTKNYTTVGRIPAGATIARDQVADFLQNGRIRLILHHPDFTTADRIVHVINGKYEGSTVAVDAGTVVVRIPDSMLDLNETPGFIAGIEGLMVVPDSESKIIVNERTGTIVMGGNVRIGEAIVAHGNLTVHIGSTLSTYMPQPFTKDKPVVTEKITDETKEEPAKVFLVPGTATVQDLAEILNQLGTTPRDMISILEALRNLGAIQMDVVSM